MSKVVKGFTFIELLMVIYILGILAAVAFPAYNDYLVRSQVAEGMVLAEPIKEAIQTYYAHRGELPPHNRAVGLPEAPQLFGQYVQSIVVSDGAIHVIYRNNTAIAEQVLSLHPAINKQTGQLTRWVCGKQTVDKTRWQVAGADATTLPPHALPSTCK